jgi:N-acetylglucosaminyldiphosphoundecaprenol N-acetyl-beta-D-mannosaminyltransferase
MGMLTKEVQKSDESEAKSSAYCLLPAACFSLAGIEVDNLSEDETVDRIGDLITQQGAHYLMVVNAAKVVAATRDRELKKILLNADLVTADGMSVVWASRVLGQRLKERVTGIDLFSRLVEYAATRGLAVYFFGATDESVQKVVEMLKTQHPALRVAGYRNGYFSESENQGIVETIKSSHADLLFVAMGSPKQEKWIAENAAKTGARFAMGVGGSFDHVSGLVRRAPLWMQRIGLEWLHRLILEPRRMWRRYLVGNTRFVWIVLKQRFSRRPSE